MTECNDAMVRKLTEDVLYRGQTGRLAELVATDHVGHHPFGDRC